MAAKKSPKKTKKVAAKRTKSPRKIVARSPKSRMVSFFIGIVTVIAISILLFAYTQSNNYKTVLGASTQSSNIK